MKNIATYTSIAVGVIGLLIGFWQNSLKNNYQEIVRANTWYGFQKANNASGTLQIAIELYKTKYKDNIDADVLSELTKADAFSQEVYKEAIRQIHFSEPSFNQSDIMRWENGKKITESDKNFFNMLAEN